MPAVPKLDDARCPRCGYDLRGTVATWGDTCPVNGTCPECGLCFQWAELFSIAYAMPRWCVEAPRSPLEVPGQAAATLVRSWLPWRFWSALRMSQPSRWGRLIAYLGLFVAVLYVAFALSHGLAAWQQWKRVAAQRISTPSTDGEAVFWQAATLPLSNRSIGNFTSARRGFTWAYETPLVVFLLHWYTLGLLLVTALLMHAGCGLTYAALPITRRRCKVRWAHIVRVTLYGSVVVVPAVVLSLVASPLAMRGAGAATFAAPLAVGAWGAIPVMEVLWWSAATSRYLRMPHAWGVGLAVTVVGILLSLAIMAWVWLAGNPMTWY
jgi:hypothetical protein